MKLKNVKFADRYTEKIVLAAAVLYFAAVAWFYILSDPYKVELGGQQLGPSEVDDYVADQAQRLKAKLDGPAPEPLRQADLPDYEAIFAARLDRPLTPESDLPAVPDDALAYGPMVGNRATYPEIDIRPPEREPFVVPTPPAPSAVAARVGMGAVDPTDMTDPAAESVVALAPDGPPFDLQWIAAGARVDMASFRRRLLESADGGARPIPQLWLDSILVLDVQVERRRVRPDGSLGDVELLPPMPGRPSLRDTLADEIDDDRLATRLLTAARTNQRDILTPAPYPLQAGRWERPTFEDEMEPDEGVGDEADGGAADAEQPDDPPNGGGAGVDPQALRLQLQQLRSQERVLQRKLQRVQPGPEMFELQQQLEEIQAEVQEIEERIERGGEMPDEIPEYYGPEGLGPGAGPGPGPGAQPGGGGEVERPTWRGGLLSQGRVVLWTTDFDVEPASKYQYRFRIITSNPLYKRTQVPASQQDLAARFALTGPWSEWTEPVELPRMSYAFVRGGSRELNYVEVEAWRFFAGRWRAASFRLAPGDPIGAETTSYLTLDGGAEPVDPSPVDFDTGGFVVDVDYDYRLASRPGGGAQLTTLRMIYTRGGPLMHRLQRDDRQRRRDVAEQLDLNLPPG